MDEGEAKSKWETVLQSGEIENSRMMKLVGGHARGLHMLCGGCPGKPCLYDTKDAIANVTITTWQLHSIYLLQLQGSLQFLFKGSKIQQQIVCHGMQEGQLFFIYLDLLRVIQIKI